MSYRILIIEDDKRIAEAIASNLADWDLDPNIVKDFHNVMAEFPAQQPHLVLIDAMPQPHSPQDMQYHQIIRALCGLFYALIYKLTSNAYYRIVA